MTVYSDKLSFGLRFVVPCIRNTLLIVVTVTSTWELTTLALQNLGRKGTDLF